MVKEIALTYSKNLT